MNKIKNVGTAIRNQRIIVGITQAQLASLVNTDQARVSGWESGKDMNVSTLIKIANALCTTPRKLME